MSDYEGKIPIFDGSNYAFWKRKMQMHLIAIDPDVWDVVSTDYRIEDPVIPSINDKRNIQNNARAATTIFMGLQEHEYEHGEDINSLFSRLTIITN